MAFRRNSRPCGTDWPRTLAAGYPNRLEKAAMRVHLLLLLALILAVGCATQAGRQLASADPETGVAAELELETPEHGFQVQTLGVLIEPGEDIRWCEVLQLPGVPGGVFPVARIEAAMSA